MVLPVSKRKAKKWLFFSLKRPDILARKKFISIPKSIDACLKY
jgi:hypothetical protein